MAPYIVDHTAVTLSGKLPAGDIWTCTIRLWNTSGAQPTATADLQAIADAAYSGFVTDVITQLSTGVTPALWGTGTSIESATARAVSGATGLSTNQAAHTASTSAGDTIRLPQEVAVAITLRTADATRRGRGRIYLPLLATTLGSTGLITQGTAVSTAVATWVDNLHTALDAALPGTTVRLCVVGHAPYTGSGFAFAVSSVAVGTVPDVQRRRRNALSESYTAHAIA